MDEKKLKALSTIDRCLGGIDGALLAIDDPGITDGIAGYLEQITEALEVLRYDT